MSDCEIEAVAAPFVVGLPFAVFFSFLLLFDLLLLADLLAFVVSFLLPSFFDEAAFLSLPLVVVAVLSLDLVAALSVDAFGLLLPVDDLAAVDFDEAFDLAADVSDCATAAAWNPAAAMPVSSSAASNPLVLVKCRFSPAWQTLRYR